MPEQCNATKCGIKQQMDRMRAWNARNVGKIQSKIWSKIQWPNMEEMKKNQKNESEFWV